LINALAGVSVSDCDSERVTMMTMMMMTQLTALSKVNYNVAVGCENDTSAYTTIRKPMTSRLKVQTVYLQIHMQFNRCKQNYIALMYADFVHD